MNYLSALESHYHYHLDDYKKLKSSQCRKIVLVPRIQRNFFITRQTYASLAQPQKKCVYCMIYKITKQDNSQAYNELLEFIKKEISTINLYSQNKGSKIDSLKKGKIELLSENKTGYTKLKELEKINK